MKLGSKLLVAAAWLVFAAAPGAYASSGQGSVDCLDGTITYSPATLWPPDHKLQSITITYGTGGTVDPSLTVNSITENEEPPGNGCGPSQPSDWLGVGDSASAPSGPVTLAGVELRSERCGTGDGRTYDINVTCCDDVLQHGSCAGESQTVNLFVTVVHNQ